MKIPLYQIDAFITEKPFSGNPAAVCPLEAWIEDEVLQGIATANNLSETAFFVQKENYFELRWFTPTFEIDLCGHATLASAQAIFDILDYSKEKIHFVSPKSGDLYVEKKDNLLYLDFPSRPPEKCSVPEDLEKGLGLKVSEVFRSRDYMVVLDSEEEVLAVKPNYAELAKLDCVCVIVTAKGREVDFVSRVFVPADPTIPEDPVTGSAHCTLIPFWAERLQKNRLKALQLSARGGMLFCQNEGERVKIGGEARNYLIGEIYLNE